MRIDFSVDGAVIQSYDSSQLLSYWNSDTGIQLTDTRSLRDLEWNSWKSTVGWPVQVGATSV